MAYNEYWDNCRLALRFNETPPIDDKGGAVTLTSAFGGVAEVTGTVIDSPPYCLYISGRNDMPAWLDVALVGGNIITSGPLTLAMTVHFVAGEADGIYLCYAPWDYFSNGVQYQVNMAIGRDGILVDFYLADGTQVYMQASITNVGQAGVTRKLMVSRDASNVWRLFVDGAVVATTVAAGTFGFPPGAHWFFVGGSYSSVVQVYVDEVYLVAGVALETASYTPQPFFDSVGGGGGGLEPLQIIPLEVDVIASRAIAVDLEIAVTQSIFVTPIIAEVVVVLPEVFAGSALVSDGGTGAAIWKPMVVVDGVDRSADLVGDVYVKAERGAARIATFTLRETGFININAYTGKTVEIDFAAADGANGLRLFTGVIDLPSVDLSARRISFDCTDNLQNVLNAMDRAALDSLIGGRWSPVIFDASASNWSYAQDRLSTVQSSVDLSPFGAVRLTPWASGSTDFVFTDNLIIDGSLTISPAERSDLVNRIEIEFGYRFPRAKREGHYIDYTYLTDGFGPWLLSGNSLLTRAAVLSAIQNAGGNTTDIAWDALPTGGWIKTPLGGLVPYVGNPYVDPLLCLGFKATVTFDYTQTVDETHKITVMSNESITAVGDLKESMSGALVGETADTVAVETNNRLYQLGISNIPPMDAPAVVLGKINAEALTLTADTNRTAAENAIETLIDVAKTRIVKSHLGTSLNAVLPLHPVVDLGKTIGIDCDGVQAAGRVNYVEHRMSADSGEALTNFRLAICRIGAVGTPDIEVPTVAPTGVADGETGVLEEVVCAFHGLVGEDASFELTFPAVATAQRDGEQVAIASEFTVAMVADPLTINFGV